MTETTNEKKRKFSLTKIVAKIFILVTLVVLTLIAARYWQLRPSQTDKSENSQESNVIDLSEEYLSQPDQDDLSEMTVNEMREKGAEFVYQTLLKNQIKIEDLYSQIHALRGELTKYRSQEKIAKIIVNYVDLRNKIFAGKNYTHELQSFEIIGSSDEVLVNKTSKLKSALTDFTTKEKLEHHFADLIPELILNKKIGNDSETLFQKVRRNISRLIVIRRIDEKNPQEIDAIIVRIEKMLKQENYQDALGAALSLDPNYHPILKEFLEELASALEIQQVDQEIMNYLKSLS